MWIPASKRRDKARAESGDLGDTYRYTLLHTATHRCYSDVLARADAFADSERYTRSGLIAAALDAFVSGDAEQVDVVREAVATYATAAVGINPAIRPLVPAIMHTCRRYGALRVALVGSSTQPDSGVTPRDLDVMVDLGPGLEGRSGRYFGLIADLEGVSGLPVDLIEWGAIRNPHLQAEFERDRVVLYETP